MSTARTADPPGGDHGTPVYRSRLDDVAIPAGTLPGYVPRRAPGARYRARLARSTAAAIVRPFACTMVPATRTVGVPVTPAAVARAVTYVGQSR